MSTTLIAFPYFIPPQFRKKHPNLFHSHFPIILYWPGSGHIFQTIHGSVKYFGNITHLLPNKYSENLYKYCCCMVTLIGEKIEMHQNNDFCSCIL